jgi:hypothetical protein
MLNGQRVLSVWDIVVLYCPNAIGGENYLNEVNLSRVHCVTVVISVKIQVVCDITQ